MSGIPHIIHYCWFGGHPLPEEYRHYIDSWRKYCPDFEIREWSELNFHKNIGGGYTYFQEALDASQWAFASDYARLKIIYEEGGIYLDTDVEVIRPLETLISSGVGFIGFQNPYEATTGLGFAAAPFNPVVKAMLDVYDNRHFKIADGQLNRVPCPAANTVGLIACGLKTGKIESQKIQKLNGICVYPEDYFNPYNRDTGNLIVTDHTYTIHHYSGSWSSSKSKRRAKLKRIIPNWYLLKRVEKISKNDIEKIRKELDQSDS